jgi:hypothetical protein
MSGYKKENKDLKAIIDIQKDMLVDFALLYNGDILE